MAQTAHRSFIPAAVFVAGISLLSRPDRDSFFRAMHEAAEFNGGFLAGLASRLASWISVPFNMIKFYDYWLFSIVSIEPSFGRARRLFLGLWGKWLPLPTFDDGNHWLAQLQEWASPKCSRCVHGICIAPETCLCTSSRYTGPHCNLYSPPPAPYAPQDPPADSFFPLALPPLDFPAALALAVVALHLLYLLLRYRFTRTRLGQTLLRQCELSLDSTLRRGNLAAMVVAPWVHAGTVAAVGNAAVLYATAPGLVEDVWRLRAGGGGGGEWEVLAFLVAAGVGSALGVLAVEALSGGGWGDRGRGGPRVVGAGGVLRGGGAGGLDRAGWCGAGGIIAAARALSMVVAVGAGSFGGVGDDDGAAVYVDPWTGVGVVWMMPTRGQAAAMRDYLAVHLLMEGLVHGLDVRAFGSWMGGVGTAFLYHWALTGVAW